MSEVLPRTNKEWLREVQDAFFEAYRMADKDEIEIEYLYRYAPTLMIQNRRIEDKIIINEIRVDIEERVQSDWSVDAESKLSFKFHFASSYIFSHVPAEMIDEISGDRVMDYVVEKMELFNDA